MTAGCWASAFADELLLPLALLSNCELETEGVTLSYGARRAMLFGNAVATSVGVVGILTVFPSEANISLIYQCNLFIILKEILTHLC